MPYRQEGRSLRSIQGVFALIRKSGVHAVAGFAVVSICLSPSLLRIPVRSSPHNLEPNRSHSESHVKQKREWNSMTASLFGKSAVGQELDGGRGTHSMCGRTETVMRT